MIYLSGLLSGVHRSRVSDRPGDQNFGRRRLTVVASHRGTCFISPFWYREFWHVQPPGSSAIGFVTSAFVMVVTLPAMVVVIPQ